MSGTLYARNWDTPTAKACAALRGLLKSRMNLLFATWEHGGQRERDDVAWEATNGTQRGSTRSRDWVRAKPGGAHLSELDAHVILCVNGHQLEVFDGSNLARAMQGSNSGGARAGGDGRVPQGALTRNTAFTPAVP